MKVILMFLFLLGWAESVSWAEDARLEVHRELRTSDREVRLYELDRKRAQDMESAWRDLMGRLTKDHYIKAVLGGNYSAPVNAKCTSLKAHGTLLTLSFEDLDDDDKISAVVLKASDVQRLEMIEEPW